MSGIQWYSAYMVGRRRSVRMPMHRRSMRHHVRVVFSLCHALNGIVAPM